MPKLPFHAVDPKKVDRTALLNFADALDDLKEKITSCDHDIIILKDVLIHKHFRPEQCLEERIREKVVQLKVAIQEVEKTSSPYLASLRLASDQKRKWF